MHRVLFALEYGKFPEEIDHLNRKRDDNRLKNLVESTRKSNALNVSTHKIHKNSRSGITGVSLRNDGRWVARIWQKKKVFHIGSFNSKKAAMIALNKVKKGK